MFFFTKPWGENGKKASPAYRITELGIFLFFNGGTEEGILAKYPTGGLTRGEKKQIKSNIGKKNLLEDF